MDPTVGDSQKVEVLDYDGGSPAFGDVVAFVGPSASANRLFIKRIIGLPGDTIRIGEATGSVTRNGIELDEPYIQGTTTCVDVCSWTVPEVLSEISIRYSEEDFQPLLATTLVGDWDEACAPGGCYFVLGDNRQNSSDSRQGWFVPAENIVGFIHVD